ncbi:hypothetical protein D3C72_1538390 [compost metagenome]
MRLPTDHLDPEPVRGGHQRPPAHRDLPRRHAGKHVQPEYRLRLELGKQPFLEHQRRPALLRRRRPLLGGLEDQHHLARQVGLHLHQRIGHPQQRGRVRVVAAGVHHPHRLAAVGAGRLGGKRQPGLLGHRQRVHVRAQRDPRTRLAALDDRHHPVVGNPGFRLQPQGPQLLGHLGRGALLAIGQLRVLVEVAPPVDHLGLQAGRRRRHFGAFGRGGRGERGAGQQQGGQQQRKTGHRGSPRVFKADQAECRPSAHLLL